MMRWLRDGLGQVRGQVSIAFGLGVTLIILGTLIFQRVLDLTWEEAFYFAVVTLTTVGYGDITPETGIQRIAVAIYVLIGTTIFVTAIGIIGVNVIEKRQAKLADRVDERNEKLHARIIELERKLAKSKEEDPHVHGSEEQPSEEKELS